MSTRHIANTGWILFTALLLIPSAAALDWSELPAASRGKAEGVRLGLLGDQKAVAPGGTLRLGLWIQHETGWHTYWKNPGIGMPPQITWLEKPAGVEPGAMLFPVPHVYIEEGLTSYGYGEDVLLIVPVAVPADAAQGSRLRFKGKVELLACKEHCIPGQAELTLEIPVATTAQPSAHRALFEQGTRKIPLQPDTPGLEEILAATDPAPVVMEQEIRLRVAILPRPGEGLALLDQKKQPLFIPYESETIFLEELTSAEDVIGGRAALVTTATGTGGYEPLSGTERFGGLLQYQRVDGAGKKTLVQREVLFDIPLGDSSDASTSPLFGASTSEPAPPARFEIEQVGVKRATSLPLVLLFSFLGGILLNVMPCVLPVLSIKVLGLVQQASDDRRTIFLNGVAYTLGILASFLTLALAAVAVKASGEAVGWGFQFQNAGFVAALISLIFVFALSMFGIFEFGAPMAVQTAAGKTQGAHGLGASFLNGIFATLLATPCTAPFLGSALAFAFSQPSALIVLIFLVIGFGLALPFLILAMMPRWTRILPRPGAWMETFKQAMAFLLIGAAIWLLKVLSQLVSPAGLVSMLIFLTFLSLGSWIFGRWGGINPWFRENRLPGKKFWAFAVALIICLAGGFTFLDLEPPTAMAQASSGLGESGGYPAWSRFDPALLAKLDQEGKTALVDFTATWCLTCQTNKKLVLRKTEMTSFLREQGVVTVMADYTSKDKQVGDWIKKLGKGGVPVYAIFPAGRYERPIVLPEILTAEIVKTAVQRAVGSTN